MRAHAVYGLIAEGPRERFSAPSRFYGLVVKARGRALVRFVVRGEIFCFVERRAVLW